MKTLLKKTDFIKIHLAELQDFFVVSTRGLFGSVKKPFYIRDFIDQMDYAGAGTLIIIMMVALFIGMALSLQISAEFAILGLQMYTGRVVGISIISEIGPVASALVFAGRTGSGMASELGAMTLRHQVDTLRVFGINPINKLITPRILASLIMLPALTIIADATALLGGYYITTFVNNQSGAVYWDSIQVILDPQYLISGIIKPFFFGFITATISCYTGIATKGGALGLKSSTTKAFVYSTICIIISDFFITKIILILFGYSL
ncbi:MAG: ABC transporter permease [Fibrobacter sp.]|nr:ABC transporter permease [Fibrobacter sp.]